MTASSGIPEGNYADVGNGVRIHYHEAGANVEEGHAVVFVHGSGPNLSPWPRTLASVTYNATDNKHGHSRRPDWVVRSDFDQLAPITPPL